MWEERFDGIDRRFDQVDIRLDSVDGRLDGMYGKVDELRTHMGVLHEDAIGRIAATAEEPLATRREMHRGFEELKELILRRIEPLELTVRDLVRERNSRA